MKVAAKTEYACLAMLELALQQAAGEPVRIRAIAEQHQIPQRFLVQILLQLKGAGLVASTRGASGGYQLARSPEDISLAEIIQVIEGPPETPTLPARRVSPAARVLVRFWQELARLRQDHLEETTLADLCEKARLPVENMYYI